MAENKPVIPINEGEASKLDPKFLDLKIAISYAIVFAIGIISGYYLTSSGVL